MRLVRSKTAIPHVGSHAVPRPRIVTEIAGRLFPGAHIRVNATAGSGKTTAVVTALADGELPVAWLTVDRMDASPGRLLVYIQAALMAADPAQPEVVSDSLRRGSSLLDTAAFLAESVEARELVFVVDDTEKIADSVEACELLDTFIQNLPPAARSILIGREDVGSRFLDPLSGSLLIEDKILAFTPDEAEQVLTARGVVSVDAAEAVQATAGWITGILFELWRYSDHRHGDGGEADPLNGYLSDQIMARLSDQQREALITTSVLDEVTPPRAEALGVARAGEVLHSLSRQHLPLDFNSAKTAIRCHPRFREYLQAQFQLRDADWARSVRRAHGQLLVAERRSEEAVGELLAGGDTEGAAKAAAAAMPTVLDRLDFALAEHWLEEVGTSEVRRWPRLVAAAIQIACEAERYGEGAEHADRLLRGGMDPEAEVLTPSLLTTIAWCYFLVSRIKDARALLASAPDVPEVRVMRFCMGIELLDDPAHYRDRPLDCDGPVDGLLARADLAHGRFARVLETHSRPWAAIRLGRVGALRALGRTAEAAQLLEATPSTSWTAVRTRAELMADLGRPQDAYTALLQGRDDLSRSGSNLYRMFSLLFEASLALRFRRDSQFALAALNEVEREPTAQQRARIVEQLHMWRGLAALIEDDAETAVAHLRAAVELMTTWDRLLNLPIAATYLAEAEWRLGDSDAADTAADAALKAAEKQGSRHLLIQALKEFPAVVSRRLDAETEPDSVWHVLGRAVLGREPTAARRLAARVTALDLGQQAVEVDGETAVPKLVKSVELLALLAVHGGRVSKSTLIAQLFENSSAESAAAYFRMALSGLRKILPADVPLGLEGTDLVWSSETLTSTSLAVEVNAASIAQLPLVDQERVIAELLEQLAAGEFLPQSKSEWVVERRALLAELHTELLEMAAVVAYRREDYLQADKLATQTLERDPLRERAWRLSMRVASALGDRDRVTAAYQRCVRALDDIGAAPEAATTALARQLRGEMTTSRP